MSETDKIEILEMVKNLGEKEKQFILGYAAGVVDAKQQNESNGPDQKEKKVG